MRARNRKPHTQTPPDGSGWAMSLLNAAKASGQPSMDPAIAIGQSWNGSVEPGSLSGLTPTVLASYLLEFHEGNFANVARVWDVLQKRDDAIITAASKLRGKVLRRLRSWQIDTMDDSPEAIRQRDYLADFYNRLTAESAVNSAIHGGVRQAAEFALDAAAKQYSFQAKAWSGKGANLTLKLRQVPLWFFGRRRGEWLFDPTGLGVANSPLQSGQWLIAADGFARMESASVLALFKRLPMHQLVNILEKWGIPSVVGKTSAAQGSAAWNSLVETVSNLRSGFSAVLSGDSSIDTVEPKHAAGMELHRPWINDCNEGLTRIFLGGSLSTIAAAGAGTLAGGAQSTDMDELIDALVDWLVELFQEQIDRDALRYGLGVTEPLAWFDVPSPKTAASQSRMAIFESAVKLGAKIPVAQLYDEFDLRQADDGEDVLEMPMVNAQASSPFAPAPPSSPIADNAAPPVADIAASPVVNYIAKTALNGAQISSLVGIITTAAKGEIPDASVWPLMIASFPGVPEPTLRQIADSLRGFTPDTTASLGNATSTPRRSIFAQSDLAALEKAALKELGPAFADQAEALAAALGKADSLASAKAVLSGFSADPAIQAKIADIAARTAFSATLRGYLPETASIKLEPLPFKEAQEFWAAKIPVATLDELAPATWAQAQKYGLKVAGLADKALLQGVKDDLASAIDGNLTVDEFVRKAQLDYGLNSKHAETVARTNIQTAYQFGHYKRLDAQREAFPIWGFDVVSDQRTSDVCSALEGKAYPANHPIWNTLYPPNHYNCRTTVVPFESVEEAEAQGFTVMDAWPRTEAGGYFMPSEGFSSNIGTVPSLDAILPGLEDTAKRQ